MRDKSAILGLRAPTNSVEGWQPAAGLTFLPRLALSGDLGRLAPLYPAFGLYPLVLVLARRDEEEGWLAEGHGG